jgi:hypothetical protein
MAKAAPAPFRSEQRDPTTLTEKPQNGRTHPVAPLAQPDPKRAPGVVSGTPADHAGGGGANPTGALVEV